MVEAGYRVGVLDLTGGESGTRGSVALRQQEALRASRAMGIVHRENLGLPDAAFEKKLKAVLWYASQFSPRQDWRNLFPSRADCREQLAAQARHFGDRIGVRYGEPFVTREIAAVDDLVHMPVRSI